MKPPRRLAVERTQAKNNLRQSAQSVDERFSTELMENRVELVESLYPYGQAASVAILQISAILSDV
jgi:hypothetical protein